MLQTLRSPHLGPGHPDTLISRNNAAVEAALAPLCPDDGAGCHDGPDIVPSTDTRKASAGRQSPAEAI